MNKKNVNKNKNGDKQHNIGKMDIKHISGNLNSDDLYALPNKRHQPDDFGKVQEIVSDEEEDEEAEEDNEEKGNKESVEGIEEKDANKDLPFGWEKHEGIFFSYIFPTGSHHFCMYYVCM